MQNLRSVFFPCIIFFSLSFSAIAQGVWTRKTDFGGGKTNYAVGFSIGSKGYIGTGRDSTYTQNKSFWEYDPGGDTWTQKADFGGAARDGAVGFSIGSKGYVGTGVSSSAFGNDFWEYDQSTNIWTQKANFGGVPRYYATGFSIGGKGYIGTGDTNATADYVADFWEYDPIGDTWALLSFPGTGRGPGVGFSIGAKGYFGTGNSTALSLPTRDFWEYDPAINSWTQKADLPIGKCGATGFSIGGKGYIGTGTDSLPGYPLSQNFWEYDPAINSWTQKTDFGGTARKHAVAFSIGTKGYLGTGIYNEDFWEFDPNAVGMNELEDNISVSVFPNPMIENATIKIDGYKSSLQFQFDIFDLHGKRINSRIINTSLFTFERKGLKAGTYIYRVLLNGKVISEGKLIAL